MSIVEIGLSVTYYYLLTGLIFGLFFILWGAQRLDKDVRGAGIKLRLLILPGSILLWPYLTFMLIRK